MSPKVREFLIAAGVDFKVHRHAPIVSFEDAKAALPFDPGAIVKGLVFRTPDASYAIVGMRAADRADYKKIADALAIRRADLRMASSDEVTGHLEMQAGGIVPLPIQGAKVLIDRAVEDLGVVFCGSGSNAATLEIQGADLIRIARGQVGDFSKSE